MMNERPESSDDSQESADDRPQIPENDKMILDAHSMAQTGLSKNGIDTFGLNKSKGLYPHEVDSDLEDLLLIEKEILQRK